VHSCKVMGVKILGPDINESMSDFTVVDSATIRFGLNAVKGMSEKGVTKILAVRERQKFTSVSHAVDAVGKTCNSKHWECLIKAGALDGICNDRAKACAMIAALATRKATVKLAHDLPSLFSPEEMDACANDWESSLSYSEWTDHEKLAFEKALLGFYLSGHPADKYVDLLYRFTVGSIAKAVALCNDGEIEHGDRIRIGGMIDSCESKVSKRGDPWAAIQLEDSSGAIPCLLFARGENRSTPYADNKHLLKAKDVVMITGRAMVAELEEGKKEVKLAVEKIEPISTYERWL